MAATKAPAKRSRAAVANFEGMVEEAKHKLAKSLVEKASAVYACCVFTGWMTSTESSASPERDSELRKSIITVIFEAQRGQAKIDESGAEQVSTLKPTASTIYQSTKLTIASSRGLLIHYQRASQQVEIGKGVPMTESGREKDNETLQRILCRQGEMAKLEIRQMLDEYPQSSKEQVTDDSSGLDTDLWNRFAVVEAKEATAEALDGRKGETWAVLAKNAHKGVRRLMPKEEKRSSG